MSHIYANLRSSPVSDGSHHQNQIYIGLLPKVSNKTELSKSVDLVKLTADHT